MKIHHVIPDNLSARKTRLASLAWVTWCLFVLVWAEVGAQREGLFSATDAAAVRHGYAWAEESGSSGPRTTRSRLVRIDLGMLDVARAAVAGERSSPALRLNLFDDAVFRARIERSTPTRSGYALTGRLEGVPFGTVALVVNGPVIAGTVRTPEAMWQMRSAGAGLYVIREVDVSTLPPGAAPLNPVSEDSRVPSTVGAGPAGIRQASMRMFPRAAERVATTPIDPPAPHATAPDADPGTAEDDGSVIDVLVLHTPSAREAEGGTAHIEAMVELWVAETNQAYAESGIIQRIELVGQAETDYAETGELIPALWRLTNPRDGHMDEVHAVRDAYAADIVHVVFRDAEDACGVAWQLLFPEHGYEESAFTVSGLYCTAHTFAHELGHAMGLRHDRYAHPDENRPSPYAAGYVNQRAFDGAPESSRWRTVMAYDLQCGDAGFHCQPLFRFSNPSQTYRGDPLGVPGAISTNAVDGPADARRALDETRSLVAGFRSSRDREGCKPVLRPERQFVPAEGGTFEVSVTIHHNCTWTTTTDAAFLTLPAAGGLGSGALTYEVAPNEGRGRAGRVTVVSGHSFLVEQVGPHSEGICNRTLVVQQAIVRTTGADHCWNVTSAHLSSLHWLNLHDHRIGTLKAGDFTGLSGMNQLSLNGNDLTSLPAGIFAGLPNLDHLELHFNRLTALPANAFADLPGLKSLGLGNNSLSALPADIFAGLSNLERLYLGYNDLTSLPDSVFAGLSSLEELWLTDNDDLRGLPARIFAGLSSLEILLLQFNGLTTLPQSVFAGLDNLRVLWLNDNALTALPERLFSGLSSLEILLLQANGLSILPGGLFTGLDNLRRLWLDDNALTTLPEGIFAGLPNLDNLSLGLNPLGSLPERLFEGRSRLRFLSLFGAELAALPPGIFAAQIALDELWLHGNELTRLPGGVFSGLPGFTTLALHDNPGAPFTLTLELVRTDHTTFGGAVAVRVAEGAPFDMVVPLSATGATLSPVAATIGAGRVVGDSVAVIRRAPIATIGAGPTPPIPRGELCPWPTCLTGFRLVAGDSVEFSAQAPFTDHPLRPGVTPVKAIHFLELRERIDVLRHGAGLPRFAWTDRLTPGVTPVRRVHLAELREALAAAYAAVRRPAPAYSDATFPEGTVIRAAHLMELRAAIVVLE